MGELPPLAQHVLRMHKAIECLFQNGYRVQGLMLFYATVDQMAWLTVPVDEDVKGRDFIAWVDKYMLQKEESQFCMISGADLWGARCGYLHTSSPNSSSFLKGKAKKKIAYSYGHITAISLTEDYVSVRIEMLISAFLSGVMKFQMDIDADPALKELAENKMDMMSKDWPL